MITVADNAVETAEASRRKVINLPLGLLGFESIKSYVVIHSPEEEPFGWMQVSNDPALAFLVISPFIVEPDYQPEISDDDVKFLGLESPEDALIYNIVTLRPGARGTVNLKGPVVLNRHTGIAKQAILVNAAKYAVQHPLPAGES